VCASAKPNKGSGDRGDGKKFCHGVWFASFLSELLASFDWYSNGTQRFSSVCFHTIRSGRALRLYINLCSGIHCVEKPDDVAIAHSDASVTRRAPELAFMICAVDIDVTVEGVRIVFFQAMQPKNPCLHEIIRVFFCADFTRRQAAFEDHAWRRVMSDFFRDDVKSLGRFHASRFGTDAIGRGRNGEALDDIAIFQEVESLGGDINANASGWNLHER